MKNPNVSLPGSHLKQWGGVVGVTAGDVAWAATVPTVVAPAGPEREHADAGVFSRLRGDHGDVVDSAVTAVCASLGAQR